jgi:hypothetical protein
MKSAIFALGLLYTTIGFSQGLDSNHGFPHGCQFSRVGCPEDIDPANLRFFTVGGNAAKSLFDALPEISYQAFGPVHGAVVKGIEDGVKINCTAPHNGLWAQCHISQFYMPYPPQGAGGSIYDLVFTLITALKPSNE